MTPALAVSVFMISARQLSGRWDIPDGFVGKSRVIVMVLVPRFVPGSVVAAPH